MNKASCKLTLKKARAIALAELGTAAGLAPHENNHASFRRYEMRLGYNLVAINECERNPRHASISFCGNEVIYDIESTEVNLTLTDKVRHERILESVRDMAHCGSKSLFSTLIKELGYEECLELLKTNSR